MANKLAGELADVIERLIEMQASLRVVVREKLEAMRRADVEAMLAASRREGDLVEKAGELDCRRTETVARLAAALGVPAVKNVRMVTLRSLISKLEPQSGRSLATLAQRLREEMLKLAEANRVVEMVSKEMLVHFKILFAAMVRAAEDSPTYRRGGELAGASEAMVVDAMA